MRYLFLLCLFSCRLPAMDGAGYVTIFTQVQKELGIALVSDRTKLMAESDIAGMALDPTGKTSLFLVTPNYWSDDFSSLLPRDKPRIFVFRSTPPYAYVAALKGSEYRWTPRDGKWLIWSDAWDGHEYTRTKYVFDGNTMTEAGSEKSPFKNSLSTD